jgi:hypothetical protein
MVYRIIDYIICVAETNFVIFIWVTNDHDFSMKNLTRLVSNQYQQSMLFVMIFKTWKYDFTRFKKWIQNVCYQLIIPFYMYEGLFIHSNIFKKHFVSFMVQPNKVLLLWCK